MARHYPNIALHVPQLLLPAPGVAAAKWAVIACDQHSAVPAYWQETARLVGDAPSTLNLVLPEAHLGTGDRAAAVAAIHARMETYLADGTLVEQPPGFMLVERAVDDAAPRRGLVVALDLAHYDYRAGSASLIRSTEGTDAKRLPARMDVRDGAAMETPHILVLIDDPTCTVIEPLCRERLPLAYDFELMQGGGRLRGWRVAEGALIDGVAEALAALRQGTPPLLYAMGDGNHSFAAARAVWEGLEAAGAGPNHPARYALVELVNLHDPALRFAPIHRLLAYVDDEAVLKGLRARGFVSHLGIGPDAWPAPEPGGTQCFPYVSRREIGAVLMPRPKFALPAATLQHALDELATEMPALAMDYIHGSDVLKELARKPGHIGFLLPPMDKHDLFATVARDGATPRKTFSLGEAHEKRYYFECRRIRP